MGGSPSSSEVKETAAERALAETSAKKWQDYQQNFVPLENQYMQRVNDMGTENAQNRVGNMAGSQAMTQMRGSNEGLSQQAFQRNLDPTSGGFKSKSLALNSAIEQTKQNAVNNGKFAAENSHIQGLGNIVAMGNGQETTAFNSMGNLAGQAAGQAVQDAKINFYNNQSDEALKGSVVGGLTSYGLNYAADNPSMFSDSPWLNQSLKIPEQPAQTIVENPFPSAPNSYNPLGR